MSHMNFDEEMEASAVWADGQRAVVAHRDGGDFVTQWATRYGLSPMMAMDAIAEIQEEMAPGGNSGGMAKAKEFMERMKSSAAWFLGYEGDKEMAARCWLHRLGLHDIAGCGKGTASEVARACSTDKHHVKKQTANKCIRSLEKFLNGLPQYKKLPPLPSQRDDRSRANMSLKAKQNWEKATAN